MWWFTQAYRWLYIYEGETKKEYKHIIETVKPLAENFQEAVCQPKPLNECFYANYEIIRGLVVTCVASVFGHSKINWTMRTLRSNSRRERQQVQHIKEEHIKQVHNALRLTSMCNESKTRTKLLDQKEFLSLFDLIPSNGFNGQIERCSSKNARHTAKIVRSIRDIRGSRQQSKKLISQKDNNNQTTTKNIEDQLKCQRRFEFFTELGKRVKSSMHMGILYVWS